MKDLSAIHGRFMHPFFKSMGDHENGCFMVEINEHTKVAIIAASGEGWDHVSVSLPDRCPTWNEMDFIKRKFFKPDEVVIQIHPAEENHVNVHNFCLHLWRPTGQEIPLPPKGMI